VKLADLHPRRFFLDAWRDLDLEAAQARAAGEATGGGTAAYIFVIVAVSLTIQQYLGDPQRLVELVAFVDSSASPVTSPHLYGLVSWLRPADGSSLYLAMVDRFELWNLIYWAAWRVLGFLVLPIVAVVVHPRMRLAQTGLSLKGFGSHVWVYGVLFVPVLIAVIVVSFTDEFATYYPFYSQAHRSMADFWAWEVFYIAQFLSLEFFFRGFMLQPLRRTMGSSAIFAMMVPYVMIHFGKPMLECFAAVLAGIVLGTLAMRTRSIWAGFLIHVSVALSMDVAAIWQVHWR
jgi:membrane protease YdiL (CAAX protease family)